MVSLRPRLSAHKPQVYLDRNLRPLGSEGSRPLHPPSNKRLLRSASHKCKQADCSDNQRPSHQHLVVHSDNNPSRHFLPRAVYLARPLHRLASSKQEDFLEPVLGSSRKAAGGANLRSLKQQASLDRRHSLDSLNNPSRFQPVAYLAHHNKVSERLDSNHRR